jgi:hypothetical protein
MPTVSEKKEVRCKGRLPGKSAPCENVLCLEDGAFIYVDFAFPGSIVEASAQPAGRPFTGKYIDIPCPKCGYNNRWSRKK